MSSSNLTRPDPTGAGPFSTGSQHCSRPRTLAGCSRRTVDPYARTRPHRLRWRAARRLPPTSCIPEARGSHPNRRLGPVRCGASSLGRLPAAHASLHGARSLCSHLPCPLQGARSGGDFIIVSFWYQPSSCKTEGFLIPGVCFQSAVGRALVGGLFEPPCACREPMMS